MSQLGADVNINSFKPTYVPLMDQVREVSRYYHYNLRTEEVYVRRSVYFCGVRYLPELAP